MKRNFLLPLVLLGLLAAPVAEAQVLTYGGRLGMGFPGFRDEVIASQRITVAGSLVGSLRVGDVFELATEVGYQRKGNKYTNQYWDAQLNPVEDSTYLVRTNLDYLTIPLYVKVNLGGSSKFYAQAGGYYGYLFHANFTGKLFGEDVKRQNIINGLHRHDLGLILGGGIESPVRQGLAVLLDIKYQIGLKDLNADPQVTGSSKPLMNKGLVMGIGLRIDVD
ncbi:MAG: porin family protein [Bacteroidales bacterium]